MSWIEWISAATTFVLGDLWFIVGREPLDDLCNKLPTTSKDDMVGIQRRHAWQESLLRPCLSVSVAIRGMFPCQCSPLFWPDMFRRVAGCEFIKANAHRLRLYPSCTGTILFPAKALAKSSNFVLQRWFFAMEMSVSIAEMFGRRPTVNQWMPSALAKTQSTVSKPTWGDITKPTVRGILCQATFVQILGRRSSSLACSA